MARERCPFRTRVGAIGEEDLAPVGALGALGAVGTTGDNDNRWQRKQAVSRWQGTQAVKMSIRQSVDSVTVRTWDRLL